MAAAAALADVHQCLEWIGFGDVQHRNAIIDEGGFDRLTDFYDINEMDIRDMAESFSKRSPAANRIIFGMRRIKWLITMMHWTQDHQRCSEDPDLNDIANADEFKQALLVSAQRASLRKLTLNKWTQSVRQRIQVNSRTRRSGQIGSQHS